MYFQLFLDDRQSSAEKLKFLLECADLLAKQGGFVRLGSRLHKRYSTRGGSNKSVEKLPHAT